MTLHYVSIFCYKNTYQYIVKMYIKMNNDTININMKIIFVAITRVLVGD